MNGSSVDKRGKTHHGKSNLFQETPKTLYSTFLLINFNHYHASIANRTNKWSVHLPVATGPRNCVVPNRKPKDKPRFKSKNSLVKHFEDMRLCRPSKEYMQVWFIPPRDGSMSCFEQQRGCIPLERCVPGKLTPLFEYYVGSRPTQDEGCFPQKDNMLNNHHPLLLLLGESQKITADSSSAQPSEVPFEQQPETSPRPSPRPSPTPTIPDSIPEPSGENLGDHSSNDTSLLGNEDDMTLPNVYDLCISLCQQVTDQAKEIKILKAKIKKLKKQAKPVIKHFKAYLTTSHAAKTPQERAPQRNKDHQKNDPNKGGRKQKENQHFKEILCLMEDKRFDGKELDEERLSTEDGVSTDKEKLSTDFEKVSTDRPKVSTDGSKVSTEEQSKGSEEIFEGSEEHKVSTELQREGTEEKDESTAGQIDSTEDQTKEEIPTEASHTSTHSPTSMIFGDDET
ncbi:hypothetical protein Tco_0762677 [Tanacetum coccineum]